MHLRVSRACETALEVAKFLTGQQSVGTVDYPGLPSHPDHELAKRQFGDSYGTMVTFHLKDDSSESAERFIRSSDDIHFCPSLGDIATTLSHPRSTSHRSASDTLCQTLGIRDGTIRFSVGVESTQAVIDSLASALERYAK